jgi:hypothetical protein
VTTGTGDFTVKEIVIEIRDAVKALSAKVDRIDEQGPSGTRDHERRITENSKDISEIQRWMSSENAVATLKRGQIAIGLAMATLMSGLIASLITFYWIHKG